MKNGGITRSTGFQVLLYFLLGAGALCGSFCILMCVWLWNWGANEVTFAEFEKNMMEREAYNHLSYICEDDWTFQTLEDMVEAFEAESKTHNLKYAVYDNTTDELLWTNTSSVYRKRYYGYEQYLRRKASNMSTHIGDGGIEVSIQILEEDKVYNTLLPEYRDYKAIVYVDPAVAKSDEFRRLHDMAKFWYYQLENLYILTVVGCFVVLICLVWLLCNAGHRWRREGIAPGVFCNLYLDVFTAAWGIVTIGLVVLTATIADEFYRGWSDYVVTAVLVSVGVAVGVVWCTIYLRELALRFKLGKWWQHTLLYQICRLVWRLVKFLWKCLVKLVASLPEIHLVVIVVAFVTLCEFIGIVSLVRWGKNELLVVWFLEKIVLIPIILYCAMAFGKLRKSSRALAEGKLSQKLDTQYLCLQFKAHAEDLNQIGDGIQKAVEERIQSERLKTELITNVSHDIKTPMTSVINYADLLAVAASGQEPDKDAKIMEYSEVLQRQAKRLKKLLEDLVEASKAATGNVELTLVPCELGVILTQVTGEYEERLAAKELKLIVRKPEEEIRILADGRQLWRVVENLMNNICKYAQEGSRVYLSMERKDSRVELIFRNISKYELDVAAEELTERFVRGDASRHMEGSGLGLSIAKSLTELQEGTMEIMTDGDLFKVVLSFAIYE